MQQPSNQIDINTFYLLFNDIFDNEVEKIITEVGPDKIVNTKFKLAIELFKKLVTAKEFEEFLTVPAYQYI
jgi:malate synthase